MYPAVFPLPPGCFALPQKAKTEIRRPARAGLINCPAPPLSAVYWALLTQRKPADTRQERICSAAGQNGKRIRAARTPANQRSRQNTTKTLAPADSPVCFPHLHLTYFEACLTEANRARKSSTPGEKKRRHSSRDGQGRAFPEIFIPIKTGSFKGLLCINNCAAIILPAYCGKTAEKPLRAPP